ncbi:hypothetical protein Cni_G22545 [Canna indica]|uniref:Uncharacterized protein n=1 Tax=Canna indica TaxID=4628 RepID=A0AAQ3KWW5_9LILI|nr:hypothetical protein Cni_G22545 [Canna indica]
MAPKRKAKISAHPTNMLPRKTRSANVGMRVGPPTVPSAKKVKLASNGNSKKPTGSKRIVRSTTMKDKFFDIEEPRVASPLEDIAIGGSSEIIIVEA